MKTDVVVISREGHSMEAVLGQVDAVAAYKGLSRKGALHLRLLAEETMAGSERRLRASPEGGNDDRRL